MGTAPSTALIAPVLSDVAARCREVVIIVLAGFLIGIMAGRFIGSFSAVTRSNAPRRFPPSWTVEELEARWP
jgi:ABC-type dipeptide/oligopeptide/nickel transport system permease component